jgi:hypothetical protein
VTFRIGPDEPVARRLLLRWLLLLLPPPPPLLLLRPDVPPPLLRPDAPPPRLAALLRLRLVELAPLFVVRPDAPDPSLRLRVGALFEAVGLDALAERLLLERLRDLEADCAMTVSWS